MMVLCEPKHVGVTFIILTILKDTNIGTRYVILAKHWIRFPDDGFM